MAITDNDQLKALLQSGQVWQGNNAQTTERSALPSGHSQLDELLVDNGWPLGAVTELLLPSPGENELRLLVPTLKRISDAGGWITFAAPPLIPYAPALAAAGINLEQTLWLEHKKSEDIWWAMEQLLQNPASGIVIGWLSPPNHKAIRRLQLAAEKGGGMAVICRSLESRTELSAAALRIALLPNHDGGLTLEFIKSRGRSGQEAITLSAADLTSVSPPAHTA